MPVQQPSKVSIIISPNATNTLLVTLGMQQSHDITHTQKDTEVFGYPVQVVQAVRSKPHLVSVPLLADLDLSAAGAICPGAKNVSVPAWWTAWCRMPGFKKRHCPFSIVGFQAFRVISTQAFGFLFLSHTSQAMTWKAISLEFAVVHCKEPLDWVEAPFAECTSAEAYATTVCH